MGLKIAALSALDFLAVDYLPALTLPAFGVIAST
jgi:hypothetical protein